MVAVMNHETGPVLVVASSREDRRVLFRRGDEHVFVRRVVAQDEEPRARAAVAMRPLDGD